MAQSILHPSWLEWPEVRQIEAMWKTLAIPYCFFGGAVRDALLDKTPGDIDLIVGTTPKNAIEILRVNGLEQFVLDQRTVRTTVGQLQCDLVMTEHPAGRKSISFKQAVREQIAGGEFTFNCFYFFPPDELHDDYGGKDDLEYGRVAFIGNPYTQTRENPKYILRFFRFHARYGMLPADEVILAACRTNAKLLASMERGPLYTEMRKILAFSKPVSILEALEAQGVFTYAMGIVTNDFSLLKSLERVETLRGTISSWYVRLLLLLLRAPLPTEKALLHLKTYWMLKDEEFQYASHLLDRFVAADPELSHADKEVLVKPFGVGAFTDMLLLRWALEEDVETAAKAYQKALSTL
jgi:poly(A) polymerase